MPPAAILAGTLFVWLAVKKRLPVYKALATTKAAEPAKAAVIPSLKLPTLPSLKGIFDRGRDIIEDVIGG